MKIIYRKDKKIKLKPEDEEDLLFLNKIIGKDDIVSGKTIRKIKIGSDDERAKRVIKKPAFIKIKVEKTELKSPFLRISGKIINEIKDVKKGSYHTFNIKEDSIITLEREWKKEEIEKLEKLSQGIKIKILICVVGKEKSFLGLMRKKGYSFLGTFPTENTLPKIKEFMKNLKIEYIILATNTDKIPINIKEIEDKVILARVARIEKNAINEVLNRTEIKKIIEEKRKKYEESLVNKIKEEISKNGLIAYGIEEVKKAILYGSAKLLVISKKLIENYREKGRYEEIEDMIKKVEEIKGEVKIIEGTALDDIGGIASFLRFRIN